VGVEIGLEGRRALVTGAGQGIGLGVAKMFAAAGAEVAINDVVADRAQAAVDDIVAAGGRAVAAPFDVTDYAQVTAAIGDLGGTDILVNNAGNAGTAGWAGLAKFVDTEPSDWEMYLRVNLDGVMHCVRAALPSMIERDWGRVITIISDAGRIGESHMAAYCAAKAGAAGLTRAIAREAARHNVTANNIALGTMKTPVSEALWNNPDSPEAKAIMRGYLVRRPGEPDDVAGLALYLASDMASWITGQTYPLNGGFSFAL
jgi:NAD(P)-dependent dehydrogenase (short-subunit alcohol dehydrogenase family)